ncbi:MAG TPA: FecR family protein [Prolixibacteraceae bacterium]|nr:FecR family protein [Prolixibacteraceae bacterium]HPR84493.1 FecR family protein [Prolixibacteraceae bacterium]
MTDQTPWENILKKLQHPHEPEDELIGSWLSKTPENQDILNDLQVIYSINGNVPEAFTVEKEVAWKKIAGRINYQEKSTPYIKLLMQIAASILFIALGVGGSFLWFQPDQSFTEVFSPYGHKTMILLPDNSQVWLNGNSKLRYKTNFKNSRYVELTGEGLFKVTKSPRNLFTVKSKDLKMEVYGTTFNVKSYPDDNQSEVALVEGSIGLFHNDQLVKKMIPGEAIIYDNLGNKLGNSKFNLKQIISWRTDELIIENETLDNVIKYLERWYGVEITIDQSLTHSAKLSFKVKTESLTELLSIINHITPITYEIYGKQVKISKTRNS